MRGLALIVLWMSMMLPAAASDSFVVIYSDPPGAGPAVGTAYGDSEFIFVPEGGRTLLLARDGKRYLIEGLASVRTSKETLEPLRVEKRTAGLTASDFLFGRESEPTIAAGRQSPRKTTSLEQDVVRFQADLFDNYGDGGEFCVFGKGLGFQRKDATAFDRVTLTVNGNTFEKYWNRGEYSLFFADAQIPERESARITLNARDTTVTLRRTPDELLKESIVQLAAKLAVRNCALQSVLASDLIEPPK